MTVTTVSADPLVQDEYLAQLAITAGLTGALRELWAVVDPLASAQALGRYREAVYALAQQFGQVAVTAAVDFYAAKRTEAGVTGASPRSFLAELPPRSLVESDVDWAMRAARQMADDEARIQFRIEAALQKAVIDAGRTQTALTIEADDRAIGFARVARPDACYFCLPQAFRRTSDGRAGVYKSRDTAGGFANSEFTGTGVAKFHNNCHCVIEPIFDAGYQFEPHIADAERLYAEVTADSESGQGLNDFRRALSATRSGRAIKRTPEPLVVAPVEGNPLGALLDRLAVLGATPAA